MKDAVATAKDEITALYEDDPLQSLALEEIELVTEDGREMWAVTLGFFRKKAISVAGGGVFATLGQPTKVENRDYKTVYIDAATGEFVKMEIRPVP
jgi:hypothetical protein